HRRPLRRRPRPPRAPPPAPRRSRGRPRPLRPPRPRDRPRHPRPLPRGRRHPPPARMTPGAPVDAELRDLHGVDLAALTRLAEAMFGRGDRPPGWLARKLARERVDPDLSVLAVAPGSPQHAPEDMLLGYFL